LTTKYAKENLAFDFLCGPLRSFAPFAVTDFKILASCDCPAGLTFRAGESNFSPPSRRFEFSLRARQTNTAKAMG
jgi:hypothetical protein